MRHEIIVVEYMATKFDNEIALLEREAVLLAQNHSRLVCLGDIAKAKRRIEELEATVAKLDGEIVKSKAELNKLE